MTDDDPAAAPSAPSPSAAAPAAAAPAAAAAQSSGSRHEGPDHSSPYPVSRLAPSFGLVDVAAEIARADETLATVATSQLKVIAEQIRSLQAQARGILDKARKDAELHRARCSFTKKPGQTYHLYRRHDGETYFSLLAPEEWRLPQPQVFLGSYRLESDMSFTPTDEVAARDAEDGAVAGLLSGAGRPPTSGS